MIYIVSKVADKSLFGSRIELYLSIIAIIISLITIAIEFWGSQRINRINLEAKFYEKVYEEFLLTGLPDARNKMCYNNTISGTDTLIDVLNDMRRKSLFFKYRDEKFYNKICKLLQDLEDELVSKGDMVLDNDAFCKFSEFVKSKMEEIYSVIMNKYTGKICIKKCKTK